MALTPLLPLTAPEHRVTLVSGCGVNVSLGHLVLS